MASRNVTRSRRLIVQKYQVIFVVAAGDSENDDFKNIETELRDVVSEVNLCTTPTECIHLIDKMDNGKTFIIASGTLGQKLINEIHEMPKVNVIYICSANKAPYEQSVKDWQNVRGVFTSIKPICESVKKVVQQCEHDSVPMSFMSKKTLEVDSVEKLNFNQLEATYMYSMIFKSIVLEIDDDTEQMEKLVAYCRKQKASEIALNDFKERYEQKSPVWWYTKEMFLYRMLNQSLRLLDMEGMIKLGFFIRHLHRQLEQLYQEQSSNSKNQFTVYRGQQLSPEDFQHLRDIEGGLLSFNSFLSTSSALEMAALLSNPEIFENSNNVGVIFNMTIDPAKTPSLKTPYAFINDHSAMLNEEEILFTMHTVFRVGKIKPRDMNERVWNVQLTLVDEDDPQLRVLRDYTHKQLQGSNKLDQMGKLMLTAGHIKPAEELYEQLREKATNDSDTAHILHQLAWVKCNQGIYEEAITFYEDSLKIQLKTRSEDDISLAPMYNNLGLVYNSMGNYSKAVKYHEKSLKIKENALALDHSGLALHHPDLAISYNNIAVVYENMGEYSKALVYYEKDLEITKKALPSIHPSLATSYNNIGGVYDCMGDYSKALEYYEKSLTIRKQALPPTHFDLAKSYHNIGHLYNNISNYSKALEYYRKSLTIKEKALPSTHSDLADTYNNIGQICNNMGNYLEAREYYEKSLNIFVEALPYNDPTLAALYNNIGHVCNNMGNYSEALEYYEKSLQLKVKALAPNHPDLAISYNNINQVYYNLSDYKKALEFTEKNLEIIKSAFDRDHPNSAIPYSWFGRIYRSTKKYSKALDNFKICLEIRKESLTEKHPHVALTYSDIGDVYRLKQDYEKAIVFHQKALDIQEHVQCNPLECATTYIRLGRTYFEKKDYSTALIYFQKGLKIREEKLLNNHPDLAEIYHDMSNLYLSTGQYSLAKKYIQQTIEIANEKLPSTHAHLIEYLKTFEIIREKNVLS